MFEPGNGHLRLTNVVLTVESVVAMVEVVVMEVEVFFYKLALKVHLEFTPSMGICICQLVEVMHSGM